MTSEPFIPEQHQELQQDNLQEVATTPPIQIQPLPINDIAKPTSPWDPATKRLVIAVLLIATITIIWFSRDVWPLLAISAIVAYLLSPIVDLLERLHIPRAVTTILLFSFLLFIILLIPILLLPLVAQQLRLLGNFEPANTAQTLLGWFTDYWSNLPEYWSFFGYHFYIGESARQIEQNVREFVPSVDDILLYIQGLLTTTTSLVTNTATIGFNVVGGIVQAFITTLIAFFLSLYLTKDAPVIRAYVEGLFPTAYQSELGELLRRVGYIWRGFFRGQILLGIIVGVVTGFVLWLAGMPGAFVLGVIAGVFEIIPNLGPFLAMIPAVLVALIQGSPFLAEYGINNFEFAAITIGTYFVIQQLENNLLVPNIIGGSVNLHPIVVLVGVAVGLNTAGILGALLASPVIATIRVVGSYLYAKLLDYPPFEDVPISVARNRRWIREQERLKLAQQEQSLLESQPEEQDNSVAP